MSSKKKTPSDKDKQTGDAAAASGIRTRLSTGIIQMNGTSTVLRENTPETPTTTTTTRTPSEKKRNSSVLHDNSQTDGSALPPKKRRVGKNDGSGEDNKNDYFCWICHKDGIMLCCELCPRVYHAKCVKTDSSDSTAADDWVCPECEKIMKAECMETRSQALSMISMDTLSTLLKFALIRMHHPGASPFDTPVNIDQVPNYNDYVFYPMDLTILERNIKKKIYGSTEAFLADAKWVLHNCIVYNGSHHKLTTAAKMIVKICRHEMDEIEVCPDCYLTSCLKKGQHWFAEPCRIPHTLVWAKLKGYPFWPAKALQDQNNQVDVRFFGTHDRAWVPVSQIFLLSRDIPTVTQKKRGGFDEAMAELQIHINKIKARFGSFEYATFRTPYDKNNVYYQNRLNKSKKKSSPNSLKKSPGRPATNDAKKGQVYRSNKLLENKTTDRKSATTKTAIALKNKYNTVIKGKKGVLKATPAGVFFVTDNTPTKNKTSVSLNSDNAQASVEIKKEAESMSEGGDESMEEHSDAEYSDNDSEEEAVNHKEFDVSTEAANDSISTAVAKTDDKKGGSESKEESVVKPNVNSDVTDVNCAVTDVNSAVTDVTSALTNINNDASSSSSGDSQIEQPSENAPELESTPNAETDGQLLKIETTFSLKHTSLTEQPDSRSESPVLEKHVSGDAQGSSEQETSDSQSVSSKQVTPPSECAVMKPVSNHVPEKVSPAEAPRSVSPLEHRIVSPLEPRTVSQPERRSVSPLDGKLPDSSSDVKKDPIRSSPSELDQCQTSNTSRLSPSELLHAQTSNLNVSEVDSSVVCQSGGCVVNKNETKSDDPVKKLFETVSLRRETPSPREQYPVIGSVLKSGNKTSESESYRRKSISPVSSSTNVPQSDVDKMGAQYAASCTVFDVSTDARPTKNDIQTAKKCAPEKPSPKTALHTLLKQKVSNSVQKTSNSASRQQCSANSDVPHIQSPPRTSKIGSGKEIKPPNTVLNTKSSSPPKSSPPKSSPPKISPKPSMTKDNSSVVQPPFAVSKQPETKITPCAKGKIVKINFNQTGTEKRYELGSAVGEDLFMEVDEIQSENEQLPNEMQGQPVISKTQSKPVNAWTFKEASDGVKNISQNPKVKRNVRKKTENEKVLSSPPEKSSPKSVRSICDQYSSKILSNLHEVLASMTEEACACEKAQQKKQSMQEPEYIEELKRQKREHEQEMEEIRHNYQLTILEMQACWEAEKERILNQAKKEFEKEVEKEVEKSVQETKRKQWCANCGKEAVFYCCWNTSYCDYPCQEAHWNEHMHTCMQSQNAAAATENNMQPQPQQPQQQQPVAGSTSASSADNSNKNAPPSQSWVDMMRDSMNTVLQQQEREKIISSQPQPTNTPNTLMLNGVTNSNNNQPVPLQFIQSINHMNRPPLPFQHAPQMRMQGVPASGHQNIPPNFNQTNRGVQGNSGGMCYPILQQQQSIRPMINNAQFILTPQQSAGIRQHSNLIRGQAVQLQNKPF